MPKKDSSLASFLSQVSILLGVLSLFFPMLWDLGNRVSRLEGAFSVAEPLLLKQTITQTVVVTTVTLVTTTGAWVPPIPLLPSEWAGFVVGGIAVLSGLTGLYFVRRGDESE
jgi:uncharacterized membrane protein